MYKNKTESGTIKKMPEFIEVISADEIKKSTSDLAKKISTDYKGSDLVLIGALKGAFIFLADLARALDIPTQIGFVGVSSYGSGTETSGSVSLNRELDIPVKDKHVIIVEDIIDTGLTLKYIVNYIKSFNPRTVKVCSLIDKSERRKVDVAVDYACHRISEGFLVGYGLDHAENYRNLPAVYHLKFNNEDVK